MNLDRVIFKRTASFDAARTTFHFVDFDVILRCIFTSQSRRYRTTLGSQSSLPQARIRAGGCETSPYPSDGRLLSEAARATKQDGKTGPLADQDD